MTGYTLEVSDFKGLSGPHRFYFEKLNALTAPTGSGKSSVLDALRYVITGAEPAGDMINSGADSCEVHITFPSGRKFGRIRYRDGKPSKYKVDSKTVTLARLNMEMQNELGGIPVGNAKMIASGEMLAAVDSRQFGELVLSYMPETMTVDDVLRFIGDTTPEVRKYITNHFKDREFGTEEIDVFHSKCAEGKKSIKEWMTYVNGILTTHGGVKEINVSREEVLARIQALMQDRDAQLLAGQKRAEYDRAKEGLDRFRSTVRRLEEAAGRIQSVFHSEEERNSAALVLEAHRATVTASFSALKTAETGEQALETAIKNITQPVCPLSSRLVCTTDKTTVVNEMTQKLVELKQQKALHDRHLKDARKNVSLAEEALRRIDNDNAEARKKEGLLRQLEEMKGSEPKLPPEPAPPKDIRKIDAEISYMRQLLQSIDNNNFVKDAVARKARFEKDLQDYEYMYQASGPKGRIKQAIMEMYLKDIEAPCNEKAARIFSHMRIRFAAENGVTIYCDPQGMGNYVSFNSLSAGEKAAVIFIIILTLADISGFRMVIIDELSVLDRNTFESLLSTVEKASEEYDMAVFACVEHEDIKAVIEDHHINTITL